MTLLSGLGGPFDPLPTGQSVQVFGDPSSYGFGTALSDTTTPSGQSFGAVPSDWPMPAGCGPWWGKALPDGNFAMGSMTLTDNEVTPTMLQTTVFIWNTTTRRLTAVPIPTTKGAFSPPNNDGSGASGTTIDAVAVVNISGTNYLFCVGLFGYTGWAISVYGEPYFLIALKEVGSGDWEFDPTHSYTAGQLAASSAAGASAFPTKVNSFSETYHQSLGPSSLLVMPASGDLVMGTYFYATGTHSGAFIAIRPSTGVVTGFYQIPDVTDTLGPTPLNWSIRDACVNPTSSAGDERFIATADVFIRSSAALYGLHPVMEWSYNSTTGAFTAKSPPVSPVNIANVGYTLDTGVVGYDGPGNLWVPTHGGPGGLGAFASEQTNLFIATGGNIPTFEDGGAASNWYTTQVPTFLDGDFAFGGFGYRGDGIAQSVNWDSADSHLIVVGGDGKITAATLDGSPALGPELCVNGGLTSGTTGWNGFFGTSTLAVVADSDFASGFCLELTSVAGAANDGAQASVVLALDRNYRITAKVKSPAATPSAQAQLWLQDSGGSTLLTLSSNEATLVAGVVQVITVYAAATAAGTAKGFLLLNFSASAVGEKVRLGDVSFKSEPAVMTNLLDTNRTRVISGGNGTPNKADIVGGRLYFSMLQTHTPRVVGQNLPQWLDSIDLAALS